mmetsp:Transcript_20790/g.63250  ORF Transcript_20790/g.63250 Transcript_20790/m.63250 type:complete len:336 (-) Transcript_20790:61-1068(-)
MYQHFALIDHALIIDKLPTGLHRALCVTHFLLLPYVHLPPSSRNPCLTQLGVTCDEQKAPGRGALLGHTGPLRSIAFLCGRVVHLEVLHVLPPGGGTAQEVFAVAHAARRVLLAELLGECRGHVLRCGAVLELEVHGIDLGVVGLYLAAGLDPGLGVLGAMLHHKHRDLIRLDGAELAVARRQHDVVGLEQLLDDLVALERVRVLLVLLSELLSETFQPRGHRRLPQLAEVLDRRRDGILREDALEVGVVLRSVRARVRHEGIVGVVHHVVNSPALAATRKGRGTKSVSSGKGAGCCRWSRRGATLCTSPTSPRHAHTRGCHIYLSHEVIMRRVL